MKEVVVVYRKEDIVKIPEDAELVHVGYKISLEDALEIWTTKMSVKVIRFPPSIVNELHPLLQVLLRMQKIRTCVGYANRYPVEHVKEARQLRQKGWEYQKIADHISEKIGAELSAQTIWYWVNKRK